MIPISILDLATIGEGRSVSDALKMARETAITAEAYDYKRYWLAEHHGMRSVASSATAVLLANIGAATKNIRIGSGGVMLPNHAPLIIAEQFGTLAELYGNRIDLGLGRAPGTDMQTLMALRRQSGSGADQYPQNIRELQSYLGPQAQPVLAVPGQDTNIPLWLLGSSLYSAQLAAEFGLPYAFASHFAPDQLHQALDSYRGNFKATDENPEPYSMAGVMAVIADTEEEANYLYTSVQQKFLQMRTSANTPFPKPVDKIHWSIADMYNVEHVLQYSLVGTKESIKPKLADFIEKAGINELIMSFPIHDPAARLKSVKLMAELRDSM
ncbi:LLM class flavin-dependent oxidoreductase [Aliiglaciecola sp. SL4]|uniref:LLM class flavin-dependent oxidoreductase n=1 Tax=Aliiglaciecola sp. SL4 TaxID=3239806 RepID=UPI00355BD1C2